MTTVIRVLDPSCAAIQAVLHDKAAVVANGRDVGFIRNAAAHSIGLNVFAVLAAPQHHERLEDLAKSFKVFPDMKDIRVNSQLLLAATSRIALLISSANKSTYDSQLKCDESKQKASSANHKKARNIYTKRTDLGAAITEEKFNEILALVQTDSCTAELKQKLKDRGIPEDEYLIEINDKAFDVMKSLVSASIERERSPASVPPPLQSQPQPQPQFLLQLPPPPPPQPQPMSQPQPLLALQQYANYARIDNLDVNDLVGMLSSPQSQPQSRPLSQVQPLPQTSAQPAVPPIIFDQVQLHDNLGDDLGLPPPQASFTAAFGTLGGGLGGGLSGRKKKRLPPTNEWGGKYTVVPRPLPPFAAPPQQLLPTETVVSGSIVLAPEVESPGAYGAGLGAGFGADFGDLGGLETLLDGTLGGSTVMGRGMAWHDGHGMAAPAPGLEPLFGLGPLSRLTELTPIGPDGAQPGAAFHEAPEPRLPSRTGSSRTSRLVTEGELARVAAEAHARGFASGAAAGSAHGLVKGMEIGASVASKTVACLADRFVDLENKIEKSGQAVLKAVEHSSNETLEAVEEVREAVQETRSELKEGFQGVADAFMRLEESLFDGLDALEDRQAELRKAEQDRQAELRKAEEDRQAELRKAERAARRDISAGEAQRHAALYSKVSEVAASMSGAVMSAGFDAGVEKKKPEEATMEVADGEAKRVAKRQASAEANSVKRLKEASRERSHILPFTARRSFATPPLSPLSKAKANRGL